jgi:RNA polymerase sigma-70 factor (ECF subfamily)
LITERGARGQSGGVATESILISAAPTVSFVAEPLDFDAVYDEHFAFVWRSARRLGVPEAAAGDVVQDVFLVLHRRIGDFDGHTPVKRWLLGITTRVVADHRRRFRRKDSRCSPTAVDKDGGEMLPSRHLTPLEEAEQNEALALVAELLDQLEADKRELLILSELEEMSVPEIADALGINLNTAYARLRAARRAFDAVHARYRAKQQWRAP